LKERSFQERLIWLAEAGVAERPSGASGTLWGVEALATLEKESPAVLNAATR